MSRPDGYLLPDRLNVDRVLAEVARGFGVTVEEMLGRDRTTHVHMARVCAMAVIRQWTHLSYPAIGRLFDRDHTTVMHAVAKVMDDPELARSVELVASELSPPPRLFLVETIHSREAG